MSSRPTVSQRLARWLLAPPGWSRRSGHPIGRRRRAVAAAVALPVLGATIFAVLTVAPAVAAACAAAPPTLTSVTWAGPASGGDWNDTANWPGATIPNGADFVCIPATVTGAVTISALSAQGFPALVGGLDAEGTGGLVISGSPTSSGDLDIESNAATSTIHNLTLSAGILQVDSQPPPSSGPAPTPIDLQLTGSGSWTGGAMQGIFNSGYVDSQITVAAGASLTIDPPAGITPAQQPGTLLINRGAIDWTAGSLCLAGDGLENASGGTFTLSASDDGGLSSNCSDVPAGGLTNDQGGVVDRTGAAGTAESITLPSGFTNNGTLKVSTLLSVNGSYLTSSTSTYEPVLSGSGPAGTGYGQVTTTTQGATGAAARPAGARPAAFPAQTAGSPGTISPTTASGFFPANGESFAVVSCASSCAGGYGSTAGGYSVQQGATSVSLVAVAQASPSPSPLNFGTALVGSTVPLTETLTNPGSGALTVTGVTKLGTDPNDFFVTSDGCSPAGSGTTLDPGASCKVTVSFDPSTTGSRSAVLSFADDAAGTPQNVALVGSGTTTPASVIPPPSPSPSPKSSPKPGRSPTPSAKTSPKASPAPTATVTPSPTSTTTPVASPTPTATAPTPVAPTTPGSPSFTAVSPKGLTYGPAGSGLTTAVHNYPAGCTMVYFFFDATRIGSAPVNASGQAAATGLSVPGNAKPGGHTITSSCESSGASVVLSANFRVTAGIHRSAFDTSLNNPAHIDLTAKSFALSAAIAGLILALVAFPSQIFNATLQEHYEEVRGWFHLKRPLAEVVKDVNQRVLFPIFLLVGGLLFALITPDFGFNRSTLALVLGLAIAVAVVTVGFAVPTFIYFLNKYKDRGQILVMPGSVIVALACVGVSRLLHFEPGYLYGLLAIFVFHHETDEKTDGKLAAASALVVIALAIIAWVARVPLTGLDEKNPSFIALVLEAALGGAFVIGVESVLVGLLPMRFLDGSRIKGWNTWVWLGLFLLGIFVAVQILIQPGTGYVGHTSVAGRYTVLSLYLAFCAISGGFWAYFRYRKPKKVEEELDTEGDYGVR
ncbi:MAG TPA: FGLLP motif-containing membrane protein [Actinomycetota bacterium]|nr:FGLLP motif-containing membrane protein [Actinomycetota bacterium]